MLRWAGLALIVFLFAGNAIASSAQTYDTPKPIPRSTDVPTLHAQAVDRIVHERFRIGLDAEARDDWVRAATEFESVLALNPSEPRGSTAHYDLSIAYANLGRDDDAALQLRAAIAIDPGFLAAMANLVAVDARRGDLREARSVADRFVALAPDSARALYSHGIVALEVGDAKGAQADFTRLLVNNPSSAIAHYDLGLAEVKLGSNADAEREFGSALAISPTYARARVALGAVLLNEGRRAEARVDFDRAARDAQGDPTLQNVAIAMRDAITQ